MGAGQGLLAKNDGGDVMKRKLEDNLVCFGLHSSRNCGRCARCVRGKLSEVDVTIFDLYTPTSADAGFCRYYTQTLVSG